MNLNIKILDRKSFPEKLLKIKDAPKRLYAIGNIELLYEDSFGIVGTRKPTSYGIKNCEEFSKEISLRDIPIVSGMALGIDEIAHRTTLECKGKTIAVLGCGFGCVYPEENKGLFEDIIKNNGLVLSEYSENTEKSSEKFPKRNRIIAAISEGVLVVEAANKSGSLITARKAMKYEKRVFAIPGKIDEKMSVGTNLLIKENGILVTNYQEILNYFPQFANKKRKTISKKDFNIHNKLKLKEDWKSIYCALEDGAKGIEEIQLKTGKQIKELLKILSIMELEDILIKNDNLEYEIKLYIMKGNEK